MRLRSTLASLLFFCAAGALAQSYPVKPIRFISPQPPGGTFDLAIRLFSEQLLPTLGQPMVIEHKVGAGTVIGLDYTAHQAPDGYTLVMTSVSQGILPSITTKLPFDPVKSFTPITIIGMTPFILVVRADSPVRSVSEFVAMAKAKPGFITYGSSGIGTPLHFGGEVMKGLTGIDMLHVPYKGGAPIIAALLSGELVSSFAPATLAIPQVKAGKLRALGNLGSIRTSSMPDLPNIGETLPGYAVDAWMGVMGPAGMPRPIVDRLNAEFNRVVRDPAFGREKLTPNGIDPLGTTPERMQEQLLADIAKYAKVVKDAGIKPE